MANSFKKMIGEKLIKRTDNGMFMRLSDIHVKEGFNKRVDDERTQQADDQLFSYLASGGKVPPLEVTAREDGGVWVVEGHRRRRAYQRCADAGKPVEWIAVTQFSGSDVERIARIMTSNNQLSLTSFEQAMVIKELSAFNLTPDEIAKLVHLSRTTVDKLLIISTSNHDVQTFVKDGAVAVDVAVDRVKEHGESAGTVLAGDVKKAKDAGKNKVTRSVIEKKFSNKKSAAFLEILATAEILKMEDKDVIVIPAGKKIDLLNILEEYRQSTSAGGD